MNTADRRDLYNGFGDSLARAVELVTTPAIFGFLGWLLDGRLGTRPLFMILFGAFVFGYVAWKMWMGYDATMRAEQSKLPSQRRAPEAPDG